MADYREFRRKSRRRRLFRRIYRTVLVLLIVAALVGGGWFAARKLGFIKTAQSQSGSSSQPVATATVKPDAESDGGTEPAAPTEPPATAAPTAPPPPVQADDMSWNTLAYTDRTLDATVQGQDDGTTAMDFRLAAQPQAGVVELSYFDLVTFVGDSLTQGLQLYSTGIPNATYCAYKSTGPQSVVNGVECTRSDGGKEIPLEALVAHAPTYVYVMYGTNVLVRDSSYASFLTYYSKMLDMIQEALPDCVIYVQSVTPVKADVRRSKSGLYAARLQGVNDELAALALQKGCYFIDLWEVLADGDGNLRSEYAAADGIHLNPSGYSAWVEYLRTHTAYDPTQMYVAGTSYYIER